MNIENLLNDRNVLLINKVLAEALGLNASIVLRQLHYWLETNKELNITDNFKEGKWWSYRTYETYADKDFTFWSISTIRDLFKELRDLGIVETKQLSSWKADRTNWYTINYPLLQEYITIWITMGKPKFSHKRTGNQNLAFQAFINKWDTVLEAHMACAGSTNGDVLEAPSNIRDYKEEKREESITANADAANAHTSNFFPLAVNPVVSTTNENIDTSRIENNERPAPVTPTNKRVSRKTESPDDFRAELARITKIDRKIKFMEINTNGARLYAAGYTTQDLTNFLTWWLLDEWRKKNRPVPGIKDVNTYLMQSKDYFASQTPSEPFATSASVYGSYTPVNLNELE